MQIQSAQQLLSNLNALRAEASWRRSMGKAASCLQTVRVFKKSGVCAALCLLAFSASTFAADLRPLAAPAPTGPRTGFFIGLGGSYNSVKFDQDIYAVGVSNAFAGSVLAASGVAQGPSPPIHDTRSTLAPEGQVVTSRRSAAAVGSGAPSSNTNI
jgi:hypothetical protein